MANFLEHLSSYYIAENSDELSLKTPSPNSINLSLNENPYQPSEKVQTAIHDFLPKINQYPDDNAVGLKHKLAEMNQVRPEQIVLTASSSDALDLIYQVFLRPGNNVVLPQYGYKLFSKLAENFNIEIKIAAEQNYTVDPNAIINSIDKDTRLVVLANPSNPTGTWLSAAVLSQLINTIPKHILIVIDEAYFEFMTSTDYVSATTLLNQHENLIVTRTFSKAYALAGLRIGYCITNLTLAKILQRYQKPFSVSSIALVAAFAALQDVAYLKNYLKYNQQNRQKLSEFFKKRGYTILPHPANFITVDFGDDAKKIDQLLEQAGILLYPLNHYQLPDFIRISIGTEQQIDLLISTLQQNLHPK